MCSHWQVVRVPVHSFLSTLLQITIISPTGVYTHPADSTMIDTNDNTVTVCMDYIKGRCMREKCKYFHPPAHLQAKIKAAQHQANQAAVAAQAAAAAATVMVSAPAAPAPLRLPGRGWCLRVGRSCASGSWETRLPFPLLRCLSSVVIPHPFLFCSVLPFLPFAITKSPRCREPL